MNLAPCISISAHEWGESGAGADAQSPAARSAGGVGAWLIGLGVAVIHANRKNDWQRVQVATASYLVYGVLQLIALLRYPGAVRWQDPAAWFYVAFMISMVGLGIYGWRQSTRTLRIEDVPHSLHPA